MQRRSISVIKLELHKMYRYTYIALICSWFIIILGLPAIINIIFMTYKLYRDNIKLLE